jgi:N-dimethylarginine dimethylaminohydrolase
MPRRTSERLARERASAVRPKDLFLCPPTYLELKYEINPWMHKSAPFSRERAIEQWEGLVEAYRKVDAPGRIEIAQAKEGLTELCFFGDSVFLCEGKALFGHFRHAEREPERPYVKEFLVSRGFRDKEVPEKVIFEGAGETLYWQDKILFGFGKRSDEVVRHFLRQTFKKDVIDLEMEKADFYHLDTAFFPIHDNLIAYYPGAFGPIDTATIESLDCDKIKVSEKDAKAFACNSVVWGGSVFMAMGAPGLRKEIEKRGIEVEEIDVSEFLKFGGGIKCLTLQHYL